MRTSFAPASIRFLPFAFTVICMMLNGCRDSGVDPTVAELARRQQEKESAVAVQKKSAEERIDNARKYLDDDNPIAARTELRPLLIAETTRPEVIVLAARCEAADGNLLEAAKLVDAVSQTETDIRVEALFLKATWHRELQDFESAEAALLEVLELRKLPSNASSDPAGPHRDTIRAHRGLATMLNNIGRRIAAAPHLRFLATSGAIQEKELFAMTSFGDPFIDLSAPKPNFDTLPPSALALAKNHRYERDLPAALTLIERLVSKYPDSAPIMAFQGRIYADLLDVTKLQTWVTRVPPGIELEPEYWFARGIAAQQDAHHRDAVALFLKAVTLDPTDRFSYLAMSRSLTILEMPSEAQEATERFKLLDDTVRIAAKFSHEPGTREELDRISDRLNLLQRPAEALAWQMVSLKRFAGSEAVIQKLIAQREELAAKPDTSSDDTFLTCGLVRSDWPVPAIPENVDPSGSKVARSMESDDGKSSVVPIQLVDIASLIGLGFQYDNGDDPSDENVLLHQLTGGGIGVIDLELDGWPDLYLTQGGGAAFDPQGSKPNALFRNLAGQRFVDVMESANGVDRGYGQGVAVADLNQDGFPDLVVANIGPNHIYVNQGDGTFRRFPFEPADSIENWTTSIAVGDLNGDALPEVVEINYVNDPTALTVPCTATGTRCNPSTFQGATNVMWSVTPDGKVVTSSDLWREGVQLGYGFAGLIANFDEEAGNDLFIANDTIENFYWLSQSNGSSGFYQLVQQAELYGCAFGMLGQRQGCMGIAHGDFDRNGRLDLHVTNFWDQPADLYLQRDNGFFTHASLSLGIDEPSRKTVAWGTQAADFDRNGWLDLAVLNGHLIDRHDKTAPLKMLPQLFLGDANRFQLMTNHSASNGYWAQPTQGRTLALLDWNGDLKPDLICNHLDAAVALLENRTVTANGLQIEVIGTDSERDAVGAKITVDGRDARWTQWVTGGDGFLCSNEAMLDFGLGTINTIESVQVDWPSGKQQIFVGMVPNQRYLIVENETQVFRR